VLFTLACVPEINACLPACLPACLHVCLQEMMGLAVLLASSTHISVVFVLNRHFCFLINLRPPGTSRVTRQKHHESFFPQTGMPFPIAAAKGTQTERLRNKNDTQHRSGVTIYSNKSSCFKSSPSLTSLVVSVDDKHYVYLLCFTFAAKQNYSFKEKYSVAEKSTQNVY